MSLSKDEIKSVEWLLPFCSDHPIIFDIGANKGCWSDVILNEFKENCDVHLFEPNQIMLNFCRIKYDYNTNVTFNDLAVSDKSGKSVDFYYFEDFHNGLSNLFNNPEWQQFNPKHKKVLIITIDDYCSINKIETVDFLKIDVEGNEVNVIKGAKKMLENDAVKIIQIEYSPHYKLGDYKFQDIIDICKPLGYIFYSFDGENFNEIDTNNFVEDYRFENFFVTKFNIHNESVKGWNAEFIKNTKDLGKFDLAGELGVFEGLTTKYICENLLNDGGRVITIDPHYQFYYDGDNNTHPYFKDQYQRFVRNTKGLAIDHIRKEAKDAFPDIKDLRLDLWYIDGVHFHPHPYNDGSWAFATTKIGGFLVFDDYTWNESSKESIDKFLTDFEGAYELIHKDYQVVIKKTKDVFNEVTINYYK